MQNLFHVLIILTSVFFNGSFSVHHENTEDNLFVLSELPCPDNTSTVDLADVIVTNDCITLHPNPIIGEFSLKGVLMDYHVDILDIDRNVFQNLNSNENYKRIQISNLPEGAFALRLQHKVTSELMFEQLIKNSSIGYPPTHAPAKPDDPIISNLESDSFDVMLPCDPSDGGDQIIRRVVSIMPETEYLMGDFSNAVYLNNFSALEIRKIDVNNYPSISSYQSHVVRWKSVNMSTVNNGHGPYSDPLAVTLISSGIKEQVIALFETSGRTSVNTIQNLNSANAPAGVSVSSNIVSVTADGTILQDYIIHDKTIFINADNVTIKQCLITEGDYLHSFNNKRIIDISPNVKYFLIESNDFEGVKGLRAGVSSAVFQRPLTLQTAGTGGVIRTNSFKWLGQDAVKTSGGVLIEENIFYAESNVLVIPSGRWLANVNYGLHEVVKHTSTEKHYISLASNNQGNSLSDNSKWQYYDPHYDFITTFENTISSTIRRNLFLLDNGDLMIPQAEQSFAVGAVNAIRIVRNSGNLTPFQTLRIEENVMLGFNTYFSGIPIQAANTGGVWLKPFLQGNYIDANDRGEYTHQSTPSAVLWGINYDATTDQIINP